MLITSLRSFACYLRIYLQGAEKFGFNVDADSNIVYREWAPNATAAYLIGDFSKFPNSIAPTYAYSVTRQLGSRRSPYEEE